MEKIIQIDLLSRDDLFEKYNKSVVSRDLIKYMIDKASSFKRDDTIKIIINNQIKGQEDCLPIVIEGLKEEYNSNNFKYHRNNLRQMFFLIVGIVILFISTLIDVTIFKEVVLISGWVLIWEMVESEIFDDISNRKKKKILEKLLNSEIIENNE